MNCFVYFLSACVLMRTCRFAVMSGKCGSSVVMHLPLMLEVPGSIPARGEKNLGVRTRFL